VIDAHVHLWQLGRNACTWPTPDLAAIYRDFTLDDLRAILPGEVEGIILVQTQEDPADTAWLLDVARDPLALGVVGWADLTGPIPPRTGKLVGLRPMVQGRAPDWYDAPERQPGFAAMAEHGLVLDALVRPAHLPALQRLARRHPTLSIVIDHAAKPAPDALADWAEAMTPLAALPNIACKLSGLLTEIAPDQLAPVISQLRGWFGPDRLLWGSDWPVVTMAVDYAAWLAAARAAIPSSDHPAVFAGTARRIYGLA
jgi:L-fuconolactonase